MTSFSLILAPGVGAASDTTTKTETEINNYIGTEEDDLLAQRATIIDEAKKEAQEVVSEQLAIQEAKAATEAPTEPPTEAAEEITYEVADEEMVADTAEDESSEETSVDEEEEAVDTDAESDTDESDSDTEESGSTTDAEEDNDSDNESDTTSASGQEGFLLEIENPDPSYVGQSVSLNDEDREMTERILMGEAGGEGYIGMALVAQCIRDTYVSGSYSSIAELLRVNGYYGSTSITPDQNAKDVVNYIFDQGGSAVQHRVNIFYASDMCSSSWHEAQEFVCQYNYVRFFNY
jgi:hypothetical protein